MGIEIERKFLVIGDAWRGTVTQSIRMAQAYLGGERCSTRVRIEGESAKLNIKSLSTGIERLEFEYDIPVADANVLMAELAGKRVEKIRHHVRLDDVLFEIDEFLGDNRGLIVAEVELASADADYPKPAWLGREVSLERRYLNLALAEQAFSTWPDRDLILQELRAC